LKGAHVPRNPLKKRTRIERVGDRADLAAVSVHEAASTLRARADAIVSMIDTLAPPVPKPRRRGALVVLLLGVAAAAAYAIRKAASADRSADVPSPTSVTPTAPAGPTDDRLNDPALKAKVESELFADDDADKGKINIGVADGAVTLRGATESAEMVSELGDRVAAIDGVRRVENMLTAGAKT
jgi:osmotically-inducible protein OsmY